MMIFNHPAGRLNLIVFLYIPLVESSFYIVVLFLCFLPMNTFNFIANLFPCYTSLICLSLVCIFFNPWILSTTLNQSQLNNFDHDPCFFKKLIGFRMFDRLILRIFLLFNKPPNSLDIEIIFDFLLVPLCFLISLIWLLTIYICLDLSTTIIYLNPLISFQSNTVLSSRLTLIWIFVRFYLPSFSEFNNDVSCNISFLIVLFFVFRENDIFY